MHEVISAISSQATLRTYKKGSILLYQGEAPRMAYVIKSGDVKVYTINDAGEEQIATFHGAGDVFPTPWLFGNAQTTMYYYETFSNAELLTVPRELLLEHLYKPEHIRETTDYYVKNYTGMLMRVTALEQARAREKIMFTLYYLLHRYGRQIKVGIYEVDLPLTHSAMASLVGLTRETTTTELNKLKKEKVVSYDRKTMTIDKARLERSLGEDSFKDVSL
ncbi:MAG TPA: Crp/Fnr family transcriptional regulator [Candidatus Saccharimonadales bacterium]|nr:Crp/Fnr family transcriptional regulator [Candidatus Saccharimonadales bacterium]